MSKIQVTAIVIRLFAVSLFIYAIRDIPRLVSFTKYGIDMSAYVHGAILLTLILIALLIWVFPQSIAKKIIPKENEVQEVIWNNDNIASISLIIMGVYFMFHALSDIFYWFFIMLYSIGNNPQFKIEAHDKISVYVTIIEFSFSLFLIFGSRGISNLIMKFRGRLQ